MRRSVGGHAPLHFRRYPLFETLKALPPDAILVLIGEHQNDSRENKIDLGVGVYRDESGQTPVLNSVKKAEQYLVDTQPSKTYLGSDGSPEFGEAIQIVTFGETARNEQRITTFQTPGGSGSLRVAADLIMRAKPDATMWTSDPTWSNHAPLLGSAGVELKSYPYYDAERKDIRFDTMLEALDKVPGGDLVLLHGCCHNPTGMDLSEDQWQAVTDVVVARGLIPYIDIAYQGFANGLEEDAYPVRLMFERVPEMVVSSSCSKNFALYRDRVGSLSIVSKNAETSARLRSQAMNIVRTMYSMPPDHGAVVVNHILNTPNLREEWLAELAAMRNRLKEVRALLGAALRDKAPDHDFSHIERANGMFCFVGITPEQVERIKSEFGVYMVNSSRINVAGITRDNVDRLASSIAAVL
jgi:aspartate/tyrosine/aromatic aminotransferase